jgi:hypothetical protein
MSYILERLKKEYPEKNLDLTEDSHMKYLIVDGVKTEASWSKLYDSMTTNASFKDVQELFYKNIANKLKGLI